MRLAKLNRDAVTPYESGLRLWQITRGQCACGVVTEMPLPEGRAGRGANEYLTVVPVTADGYDTFFYVLPSSIAMMEPSVLVEHFDIVCKKCYQIWEEQEVGLWTSRRVGVRPRSKQSKVECRTS